MLEDVFFGTDNHGVSSDIQDRVIKATSTAGLLHLSDRLVMDLMDRAGRLPSSIAYTALCTALRRGQKLNQLESLLRRMGTRVPTETVSCDAFNMYLGALGDQIAAQTKREWKSNVRYTQNGEGRDGDGDGKRSQQGYRKSSVNELVDKAMYWVETEAKQVLRIQPDTASYATVLQAAAVLNDDKLARFLWTKQLENKVVRDVYSYNSYLRALSRGPQDVATRDMEMLNVFHNMTNVDCVPGDRFTLDLLSLPLIRAGRQDEWMAMVDQFFLAHVDKSDLVANTFSALLSTLVKGNEVMTARKLFDFYLLPTLGRAQPKARVKHFNILIDGYRRELNRREECVSELEEGRLLEMEGIRLYLKLTKSGLHPDAITLTSVLGLTSNSYELASILLAAKTKYGIQVTPIVLRAILSACGKFGDASSACWFFDEFFHANREAIKTVNSLLQALAKGTSAESTHSILAISKSTAASVFKDHSEGPSDDGTGNGTERRERRRFLFKLSEELDGLEPSWAALKVLDAMSASRTEKTTTTTTTSSKEGRGRKRSFSLPPDSQSFCNVATAINSRSDDCNTEVAIDLYQKATANGIAFDGRFVNTLLLCFGTDIKSALTLWKKEIRFECLRFEEQKNQSSIRSQPKKNLQASYHGLLHVCGRALRPDIAVRLVSAMNKENVVVNEMALQCYQAGKRRRPDDVVPRSKVLLSGQFEKILAVECTTFDVNDKRRDRDLKIRIIL